MVRELSLVAKLRDARLQRPSVAETWLQHPSLEYLPDCDGFWQSLKECANPDQVLLALINCADQEKHQEWLAELGNQPQWRKRIFALLGASRFFADYVVNNSAIVWALHPESHWQRKSADFFRYAFEEYARVLHIFSRPATNPQRSDLFDLVAAPESADDFFKRDYYSCETNSAELIRSVYRQILVQLIADDLTHPDPLEFFPQLGKYLAELTEATLEAALAAARWQLDPRGQVCFTIMGLGKTGAEELNYISDIDVIYIAEPAQGEDPLPEAETLELAVQIAGKIHEICSANNLAAAPLWPLDTALRPEGKDGALVRTLASHREYYQKWAENWEFQALLKARPIAGNRQLGNTYLQMLAPLIWNAVERQDFVGTTQNMRLRVEKNIVKAELERNLKLGPGGLRDIEFSVQLLQLVHGRVDENLRLRPTLEALAALSEGGYIARDAASELDYAYRFLRCLEHRCQLQRMQRTHLLPHQESQWQVLARKFPNQLGAEDLREQWQQVKQRVRELQQDIFYRPILPVTAQLSAEVVELSETAAQERLAAVGYLDPPGALRHIQALTAGVSRRASIQKQLLPVLLHWFAEGPNPDQGLRYFRDLSEKIGGSHWYMKLLRDSQQAAQNLCWVLSTSPYIARRLESVPAAVQWLDNQKLRENPAPQQLDIQMEALIERHPDSETAISRIREVRARELLRCALADAIGHIDIRHSTAQIATINDAVLRGAVQIVMRELAIPPSLKIAVIAMGRGGGREANYASDGDLMVVYDLVEDAVLGPDHPSEAMGEELGIRFAIRLKELLSSFGASPVFKVDYDLRPEGKNGSLARSLSAYREYYYRWISAWEKQALLRARFVAGDSRLGASFIEMIKPIRYPEKLTDTELREIRRLKARMEKERIRGGLDRNLELKLGPGGLSDVEWTVQLLQLQHAKDCPALQCTDTAGALAAAENFGFLTATEAADLRNAWQMASRIRSGNMLITERIGSKKLDFFPTGILAEKTLARLLGYDPGDEKMLLEDYRRYTRKSRRVMSKIFYGIEESEMKVRK